MEITLYRVIAEREVEEWDADRVPYITSERFLDDLYPTKIDAIRVAQKTHSKRICYVRVLRIVIGKRGEQSSKLVYKKLYQKLRKISW